MIKSLNVFITCIHYDLCMSMPPKKHHPNVPRNSLPYGNVTSWYFRPVVLFFTTACVVQSTNGGWYGSSMPSPWPRDNIPAHNWPCHVMSWRNLHRAIKCRTLMTSCLYIYIYMYIYIYIYIKHSLCSWCIYSMSHEIWPRICCDSILLWPC